MDAIQIEQLGGPEVLHAAELPNPTPGPGEVLVRVAAAGLNFVDTYHRTGLYPHQLPFVPGQEGSGVIEATGPDVTDMAPGDRVAWTDCYGSYAQLVSIPAARAVPVPDEVELETAAAALLQGMTAHYLVNDTYPVQTGDSCLLYAAAGGVGTLLTQMVSLVGGESFAVVGSAAKAEVARSAGAHHVIVAGDGDLLEQIESVAGRRRMAVVYDGVGAATFETSLRLLRRRGMLVAFGNASGPVPPMDVLTLSRNGSLFLTRPALGDYIVERADLEQRANELFDWIGSGRLAVTVGARYPLAEAAEAHRALEGRQTIGKVLLSTEY
jgi:NADPH2:quinone reductase